ncbi:MAG: ribonuclease H-like domain-containing protein [Candidatus Marinimicrobia bacterium]|nr:ribonuclease H-like domain-containing protein [Candidatus Neomarinimicrobiota bacterium]
MKNIRDRLEALYSKAEQKKPETEMPPNILKELNRLFQNQDSAKYFPKSTVEKKAQSISTVVEGSWINTHFGDIFRAEFSYDLREPYGSLNLDQVYALDNELIAELFQINPASNPERFLFIDTETTGLSGGTGTIAFMIGLGFIENHSFIVHQYFITQLSHEEGMLELLQKLIPNFDCLVSYNGKSYDIPLLNSRFVINRMRPIPEDSGHIDLLHPTRMLWKYSMENCKLKTVETDRLGLFRDDDIPGEMIPDAYFDYLRCRRIDKIERIFYHNRFDIITLLATLILIINAYESHDPDDNPLTDYAKARMFTRKKNIGRSIAHYEHVLNSNVSPGRRQKTSLELAALYKKAGEYKKAVTLWQTVIGEDFPLALEPYLELAMYYEHHSKEYPKADEVITEALARLPQYRADERAQMEHRLDRIKQKLSRNNQS